MGDGHIVLNSKLYLQLFGGGVNVFPWFSKIPCIVNHYDMSNEIFWNNKKICYWHGKKQFFHISTKSDIFYNKLEAANLKHLIQTSIPLRLIPPTILYNFGLEERHC